MIKALIALSAGILLAATAALAQPAGPSTSGPPGGQKHRGPPGQYGPGAGKHGRGPGFGVHKLSAPSSKGAQFRLREGNRRISIKCADDDSTKACIDAIGPLLNKVLEMK
jgi:hypothetical protein